MPAAAHADAATGFEVDRANHALRFVRSFSAPRAMVFEAWTTPEQLACWWDAGGERLSVCEMDLRPGGAFRFVSPSHAHMPFTGTYRNITPPERLEFEAMDAIGRVLLDEVEGGTRMTVEIVCTSAEHLEHYIKLGVANGTSQTCDNLVAFIAGKRRDG
ncbi:MAG: SRPBCC domain-containing protein [Pseudomonadota bacterium]